MIIESMLDTDLYKLSMGQVVFHRFPDAEVEYEFKLRNYDGDDWEGLIPDIRREIDALCQLEFRPDELEYLGRLPWMTANFIEFLRLFRFNRDYIRVWFDHSDGYFGKLRISLKGPWLHTIFFETPVLAIVSECFSRSILDDVDLEEGMSRLRRKMDLLGDNGDLRFADFGTRRRFTRRWHETLLRELMSGATDNLVGTSNVLYARELGLRPIGTMAHEYIQACQSMVRLADSQRFALENWAQEYRGRLGIALTDTIGMDAFLDDFDLYFAKLFDGCRHDSGDPYTWCNKLLRHYGRLGIDSRTKSAVFSDGLDFVRAQEIWDSYSDDINVSFGIGTDLTNDVGIRAPQIVLKMTRCNGLPVAKISDSPGKSMCDDEDYVRYLRSVFGK